MGKTSTEVKQRWENANYSRYVVRLRYDADKDLIDYIEEQKQTRSTSEIFRDAIALLVEKERAK